MTSLSVWITIGSPINTWQYSISCINLTLIPTSFVAHEQHEVKSSQGLLRHNSWAMFLPPLLPLLSQPWFPSALIDLIRNLPCPQSSNSLKLSSSFSSYIAPPTVPQDAKHFCLHSILQVTRPLTTRARPPIPITCCQLRRLLTFGRDALEPELWVVIVKTVVMPSATLAGAASMFIQKETQDKMTINRLGIYIWIK